MVHILLGINIIFFFFFNLNLGNIYLPLIICGVLLLINIFKKSFGFGDILVLFAIGILQIFGEFFITFWLAIFVALLYSLTLIVKKKEDEEPFMRSIPLDPWKVPYYYFSDGHNYKLGSYKLDKTKEE